MNLKSYMDDSQRYPWKRFDYQCVFMKMIYKLTKKSFSWLENRYIFHIGTHMKLEKVSWPNTFV